jgi:undecaprenyl diphosphate synthase
MAAIKHVAIIMDGNGRWANEKFRPRVWGHIRGANRVSEIVESAVDLNLDALTLYAFSTENWSRPIDEVSTLFKLLKKFLVKEKRRIIANNIKFQVIGDTSRLSADIRGLIENLELETKENTGLKLSFAFSYGGRQEIVHAVNRFMKENPGREITEQDFNEYLYRPEIGDVDLMIRTAGDQRISNFLLWQSSYAELYFTQTKWPDFTDKEFKLIVEKISRVQRRFGSLNNSGSLQQTESLKSENLQTMGMQE